MQSDALIWSGSRSCRSISARSLAAHSDSILPFGMGDQHVANPALFVVWRLEGAPPPLGSTRTRCSEANCNSKACKPDVLHSFALDGKSGKKGETIPHNSPSPSGFLSETREQHAEFDGPPTPNCPRPVPLAARLMAGSTRRLRSQALMHTLKAICARAAWIRRADQIQRKPTANLWTSFRV